MSRKIHLTISYKADSFRTWIFAEELSLQLQRSELGVLPMDEADVVKQSLRIRDIKARKLKRCLELVDELIDEHFMREHVSVRQRQAE